MVHTGLLTYILARLYTFASFMAERFSQFDAAKAGEAIGAEPREIRDVAYGDGQAMNIGDTSLEIYQKAGVTRVTTPDARIELFRVPSYHVSPERLVFQQGEADSRTRLLVRSNGRVSFYPVSGTAESSRTDETAPLSDVASPTVTAPSTDGTAPTDGTPAGAPDRKEPREEQQQLSGRLGRDPWFGTRAEEPATGFPLAVNEDGGKTTWHRVVLLGELVDHVRTGVQRGHIKKGRLVELTGIPVVQTETTAKGGSRTTSEFHATALTLVTGRKTPPAR
jgi:hypothetical protein